MIFKSFSQYPHFICNLQEQFKIIKRNVPLFGRPVLLELTVEPERYQRRRSEMRDEDVPTDYCNFSADFNDYD